jgi:hypothetical protein
MDMRKWAKITIKIGAVICCLIALFVGLGLWLCYRFDLHTGYVRRNPKKRIAYLEKVCDIDFPEGIKEVKIATAWLTSWDPSYTGYLIQFRIEPNLLESLVKLENLQPYSRENDDRSTQIPGPKWFTKPIRKGKMGKMNVRFIEDKVGAHIDIYVDTSDKESCIVYMCGGLPPYWD